METAVQKRVTKIDANPLLAKNSHTPQYLRVAAYCRVSTDDEEQLNSYEAQIAYYTEFIAKNPKWKFAGVYADEGITGTSTSKRKNFLRLMNDCERGKIDLILTKSISRFARNTVDSLSWVRKLRAMNIGVYFEEQAIDSLKAENEMLIGLFSVIAQAESENISANVRWGVQQKMKSGTYRSNFQCFGYKKGIDGVPKIVPEQAEVVREIYDRFLDGLSLDQIQQHLQSMQAVSMNGGTSWNKKTIDSILKNEKYAGDLLLQKTFIADPISKKTKKNRGELPKYLVSNNHPAIIPREKFNAVQMEIARRGSKHKRSGKTKTEQGKYSGKYALSELLICGECGNHFKRNGKKNPDGTYTYYWRCINRSENGRKACSCGGLEEKKLQKTICECLNEMFTRKDETVRLMRENLRFAVSDNDVDSDVYQMERQIVALQEEAESWMRMVSTTTGDTEKYYEMIQINFDRVRDLRQQIEFSRCRAQTDAAVNDEVNRLTQLFDSENVSFEEFDDVIIRRLVECIRVMPKDRVILTTKGGLQIERQS